MNKQAKNQQQATRTWIKIAVLLVIIFSTAALLTTYVVISNLKETNENLEQQALELEQNKEDKQEHVDNQGTDEGVNGVAKDELDMADPDTTIYIFQ
jgi:cell division protein FtsB